MLRNLFTLSPINTTTLSITESTTESHHTLMDTPFSLPLHIFTPILCLYFVNFATFRRYFAIFLQSPFITNTPVFTAIYSVSTLTTHAFTPQHYQNTSKQAPGTENKAPRSIHFSEIVKNKTRRNYNLYTVNKTPQAQTQNIKSRLNTHITQTCNTNASLT